MAKLYINCPVHGKPMMMCNTKYGPRFDCIETHCDWMCWGGQTSTPCNGPIRDARQNAHCIFDNLWKSGKMGRNAAYKWLCEAMDMSREECHIGMFDVDECNRVVEVSKEKLAELLD